eukprot:scaffold120378_cov19-Tisochrysis_lutea.AAC.4
MSDMLNGQACCTPPRCTTSAHAAFHGGALVPWCAQAATECVCMYRPQSLGDHAPIQTCGRLQARGTCQFRTC